MHTDIAIYQYLATGNEAFKILTGGIALSSSYHFSSTTLKNVERRIDAIFESQDHTEPVYIVEFQAQSKSAAWYNLLTKIGHYGENHPKIKVHGILLIPNKRVIIKKTLFQDLNVPFQLSKVHLGNFLPQLLIVLN